MSDQEAIIKAYKALERGQGGSPEGERKEDSTRPQETRLAHSMKVLGLSVAVAAMLLVLVQSTQTVFIEHEGYKVKLESVKKIEDIMKVIPERSQMMNPSTLCSNPALPSDLQPVCENSRADDIFRKMRDIAQENCELCVNVACTGCY